MEKDKARDLLTYADVARRLQVTNRHVRTLVAAGEIVPIRFGPRCVRFDPVDVDRYIEEARDTRLFRAGRPT